MALSKELTLLTTNLVDPPPHKIIKSSSSAYDHFLEILHDSRLELRILSRKYCGGEEVRGSEHVGLNVMTTQTPFMGLRGIMSGYL